MPGTASAVRPHEEVALFGCKTIHTRNYNFLLPLMGTKSTWKRLVLQAQENSRQDAMKNAMLQAIRLLIQYDGKELSQLFLKSATGYDGYLDVIENPICLMDIM